MKKFYSILTLLKGIVVVKKMSTGFASCGHRLTHLRIMIGYAFKGGFKLKKGIFLACF